MNEILVTPSMDAYQEPKPEPEPALEPEPEREPDPPEPVHFPGVGARAVTNLYGSASLIL